MLPTVFALLPDKKAETYRKVLCEISQLADGLFKGVVMFNCGEDIYCSKLF